MVFDIHRGTLVMLFAYFHKRLCVRHHEAAQRIHIFDQVKHLCDKLLLCRMILKTSPKIFERVGHNPFSGEREILQLSKSLAQATENNQEFC